MDINTLIIEDDSLHLLNLKEKLKEYCPEVKVVKEATSFQEAHESLQNHVYDLIFMDIQLGDHTAFDLLEKPGEQNMHIIFVTVFDQYAIQAFRVNAIDFLLKPIDGTELRKAVNKAIERIYTIEKRKELVSDYRLGKDKVLTIHGTGEMLLVPVTEVVYCRSDRNYTWICYQETGNKEKEFLSSRNLSYFEQRIGPFGFVRIHHSYLVNVGKIKKVDKRNFNVILTNDLQLPISRDRKSEIIKQICTHRENL